MNDTKKLRNFIAGAVSIVLTVGALIIMISNHNTPDPLNPVVSNQDGEENVTPPSYTADTPDSIARKIVPAKNIKKIGEPVRQTDDIISDDFTITLNSVKKTTNLDGLNISTKDFTYEQNDVHNEDGKLKPIYSYIFLDLTIQSNKDIEYNTYLSYHIKTNDPTDSMSFEPIYKNIVDYPVGKQYWKTSFKPNEKRNFIFGYIVLEKYADRKDLMINLSLNTVYDPDADCDQYYIAINS